MSWPDAELKEWLRIILILWITLLGFGALFVLWWGDVEGVRLTHNAPWVIAHSDAIRYLTDWGTYPFYFLFLGILFIGWYKSQLELKILTAGYWFAQLLGAMTIVRVLKMSLGRARPGVCDIACSDGTWIGSTWNSAFHSFPSGHMADAMISAIFTALLFKRVWAVVLIFAWAVTMGLTRVALAVHYPSDVLAGALIGGIVSLATLYLGVLPRCDRFQNDKV
jgi:undecaprenyl-diphosphatase